MGVFSKDFKSKWCMSLVALLNCVCKFNSYYRKRQSWLHFTKVIILLHHTLFILNFCVFASCLVFRVTQKCILASHRPREALFSHVSLLTQYILFTSNIMVLSVYQREWIKFLIYKIKVREIEIGNVSWNFFEVSFRRKRTTFKLLL